MACRVLLLSLILALAACVEPASRYDASVDADAAASPDVLDASLAP